MSQTKPQPELTIELNMDIKTNTVISGIKLNYLSEKKTNMVPIICFKCWMKDI